MNTYEHLWMGYESYIKYLTLTPIAMTAPSHISCRDTKAASENSYGSLAASNFAFLGLGNMLKTPKGHLGRRQPHHSHFKWPGSLMTTVNQCSKCHWAKQERDSSRSPFAWPPLCPFQTSSRMPSWCRWETFGKQLWDSLGLEWSEMKILLILIDDNDTSRYIKWI